MTCIYFIPPYVAKKYKTVHFRYEFPQIFAIIRDLLLLTVSVRVFIYIFLHLRRVIFSAHPSGAKLLWLYSHSKLRRFITVVLFFLTEYALVSASKTLRSLLENKVKRAYKQYAEEREKKDEDKVRTEKIKVQGKAAVLFYYACANVTALLTTIIFILKILV